MKTRMLCEPFNREFAMRHLLPHAPLPLSLAITVALFCGTASAGTVDVDLAAAIERDGAQSEQRVVVVFEAPAGDRRSPQTQRLIAERRNAILHAAGDNVVLQRGFQTVAAFSARASAVGVAKLKDAPTVLSVGLDPSGSGSLSQALPIGNFPEVQATGLTGAGRLVAVLDTGIDLAHPDLNDDVVQEQACFCFPGCCPNGLSTQLGAGAAQDDNRHGTHVGGIIASDGDEAPAGAAPGVRLFPVKVMDANNSFQSLSDIIAGLDFVFASGEPVDVVQMSLGTAAEYSNACDNIGSSNRALSEVVANLNSAGTVVVASTGNDAEDNGIQSPSCIDNVIATVATYDADIGGRTFSNCTDATSPLDRIACFSNVSAEIDISAPGYLVTAPQINGGSISLFGTSMAAPQVSACVALLREAHPTLSVAEVKQALLVGSVTTTDTSSGLTAPRLDCLASLNSLAPVEVDAGPPDAGPLDAGFDAGALDAGFDAGALDAGFDAGPPDAGETDAGESLDAGVVVDAGAVLDAGETTDAGVDTDAGADVDAGQIVEEDAGTPEPGASPEPGTSPEPELAGCTCESTSSGSGALLAPGLLALVFMLRRRRRVR